jgi:CheY-like chemotaxis protein
MTDRARVLLVDDRPENLLALEAILSPLDVDLVRAGSGDEALRALLRSDFALILLDAQMPGMDGFETATRIKRRHRTKDVPIIFVTAVDKDQSSSYRGFVAGGADYISKPFDPWILRAKVQVFVDLWQARLAQLQAAGVADATGGLGSRLDRLEEAVADLASLLEHEPGVHSPGVAAALDRVRSQVADLRGPET